jgi:hypothetical protein
MWLNDVVVVVVVVIVVIVVVVVVVVVPVPAIISTVGIGREVKLLRLLRTTPWRRMWDYRSKITLLLSV